MSGDLGEILARTEDELTGANAPAGDALARRLHHVVRRRRIVRRSSESVAAVAVLAVVATGAWFGVQRDVPEPATPPAPTSSTTPTVSPTPSPTPTATPTPTPTGPPERADAIDDATVVARLTSPRTGEVWTTPERAPADVEEMLRPAGEGGGSVVLHVGHRGDAQIYVEIPEPTSGFLESPALGASSVLALYEIDGAGPRDVLCPSARASDPCADRYSEPAGVVADTTTFYDTFTFPRSIAVTDDWVVSTEHTMAQPSRTSYRFGDPGGLENSGSTVTRTLRTLGPLAVVEVARWSGMDGFTNVSYGVLTPIGSVIELDARDVPGGDYAGIRWDDGVARAPENEFWPSIGAGAHVCSPANASIEDAHVATGWHRVGTTADGLPVHVPRDGGGLSAAVRAWHEAGSGTYSDDTMGEWVTGAAAGYRYPTDEAFHEAHALYAVPGPAGEWLVRIRSDAGSLVYECA